MLLNVLFINLHAQTFDWAKREGLWAYDYGYGITTDNAGNVYVAGKYEENANFSNTILPCQGNHDIYLVKYDAGGALQWVTTAGGSLGDYAEGVTTDGSSYVCIAGEIEGVNNPVYFQNSNITLTSKALNDIFVAKYDLSGNLLWANEAGWYQNDKALSVTHDNAGNIYICGYFNDTAKFGANTFVYGYGGNDIFVAKYDANGNFQWVQKAGGPSRDEAKSIVCDASGNVYITGMFIGTATFGSQQVSAPNGYMDTYLAKYSPSGVLQWVKNAGGAYDDVGWCLAIDNSGRIYMTGEFNAYATFDNIALTTSGNADAYVACYDQNGNVQWAKDAGGTLIDRARGIGTDGTDLYITGQFGSTASFGGHTVVAADSSDIFIAKINSSGNFIWAMSVGGTPDSIETLGYECGNAICAEANGYVFATGSILDNAVFGTTTVTTYDRTDMFVTRVSQASVGIPRYDDNASINIYPNPGTGHFIVDLGDAQDKNVQLTILDELGRVVDQQKVQARAQMNVDITSHDKGIYLVELRDEEQVIARRKIVLQ
jgi:hypothetical protein